LPSLKYFFPAVPKPNEKPKALTSDQKAQNTIYMRELRKVWYTAQSDLENSVVEFVAKGLKSHHQQQEGREKEAKSKAAAYASPAGDIGQHDKIARTYEALCLQELSLKRLRTWIEEDEDKKLVADSENALEKLKLAKVSHEQFVKKKDSLRIRMPDGMAVAPAPAMSYGKELAGVKAARAGPQTTVELMAGSGLKYVHATNRGRQGMEGDLEKSRKEVRWSGRWAV
jgi:hypothetical protein